MEDATEICISTELSTELSILFETPAFWGDKEGHSFPTYGEKSQHSKYNPVGVSWK